MKEECLICKAPLAYLEEGIMMECAVCHKKEMSRTRCVNGLCTARNTIFWWDQVCSQPIKMPEERSAVRDAAREIPTLRSRKRWLLQGNIWE